MDRPDIRLSRRAALASAGASLALSLQPASAATATRLPLTAQTTEGPYYFDAKKDRGDITEDRSGVPLEVRFQVLGTDGKPLPGLRVDIWHCDAQGQYSGYAGQGEDHQLSLKGRSFLRGSQRTGTKGEVAFRSIYPGWYRGRTTHIHMKVLNGSRAVLTSQFFLPDALSEFLYTQVEGYKRAALRDTLNSNDGIAIEAGNTVIGSVRETEGRYVAALTLVVDPRANPVVDRPLVPGDPPPDGMAGPGRPGPAGGPPPEPQALQGQARLDAIVPHKR